ncbi:MULTISPECIES: 6-phosphofructokinase [Roseivirga]|jgi:6-phosphofructokinase 1|uniref:ATP-dependent 6-phosphofructokinase n=1 Tax=Roseivirga thermotolerans TaxID=1758176 RepID=A0ABQ3ID35_9BACT|nr:MULTISPECIES: 6-phosphofructokinase [Roseivirga]MEC7754618.1 6-phosphofructokinase [Bacteroidota bacterium]GHE74596.1 ATP-dependent 6-phosphofructokinase [Roseivirga thermotolerans]|tara:strand:+ start:8928 stop:9911 length:984 start_codon:yes stop_codon:yes gene_type:complete
MTTEIKKIGVLTSGGDAPGMNAAVRAVVRACIYYDIEVFGIYKGYDGLIKGNMEQLYVRSVSNILSRGGTFLLSARSKEFRTKEGRKQAYEHFKANGLDALVVIGGDGSFTGADIFSQEFNVPVIGIPGTIDNDLSGTDFTIGFDTACNTAREAIDKIRDTASSHERLFFVEVMGRDAGFIALNSAIGGGAVAMIVPEHNWSIEALINRLRKGAANQKASNVVIVAEGCHLGSSYEIAAKVKEQLDYFDIRVTVLGHLQRGGTPTTLDRVLASRMGVAAVEGLRNGQSNVMVGIINNRIAYTPIGEAIKTIKRLDDEEFRIAKILSI